MAGQLRSGIDAWTSAVKSGSARWHTNIARFSETSVMVEHEPKFSLTAQDTFFCIGSCFARNVEEYLIYSRRPVLSKRVVCPVEEWPNRVNGFVNKFTTNSVLNEIQWTICPPTIDGSLFEETKEGWMDLQLCPGVRPVTLERAKERRAYLMRDYFSRLHDASVIILTLGL